MATPLGSSIFLPMKRIGRDTKKLPATTATERIRSPPERSPRGGSAHSSGRRRIVVASTNEEVTCDTISSAQERDGNNFCRSLSFSWADRIKPSPDPRAPAGADETEKFALATAVDCRNSTRIKLPGSFAALLGHCQSSRTTA